jgi:hypothetical protein
MLGVVMLCVTPWRPGALKAIEDVDEVVVRPVNVATPEESVVAVRTPATPVPEAVTITPALLTALPEPSLMATFGLIKTGVAAEVATATAGRSIARETPVFEAT